jgi:hypothetical protein
MSPSRRQPYHAPRPRREVYLAVAASGGLAVFTVIMVWVLGPHTSSSGTSSTVTTSPHAATTTTAASGTTTTSTAASTTTSSTAGK